MQNRLFLSFLTYICQMLVFHFNVVAEQAEDKTLK